MENLVEDMQNGIETNKEIIDILSGIGPVYDDDDLLQELLDEIEEIEQPQTNAAVSNSTNAVPVKSSRVTTTVNNNKKQLSPSEEDAELLALIA